MNEMRKLMEAVKKNLIEDWDDEEEFDEEDEHYDMANAEIEKFKGRKIFVTDLYDGDIYGILGNKHGPRFMISAPMWRGDVAPQNVTADEIEVHSPSFDLNSRDEELLRRWYMETTMDESVESVDEDFGTAPGVREITNKLHEEMDEQILDPRAVADACLKYMSESDVAEMARINELLPYYEDDEEDY